MNAHNRNSRLNILLFRVSLILLISISGFLSGCGIEKPSRSAVDFNFDWQFMKGEQDESVLESGFDDTTWEAVRLPHDWAISGPFDPDADGSTGKLPWKGVGWYRKEFTLTAGDMGRQVYFDFDGIMAFPEIYINGQLAGSWDYGYVSFRIDATPYVKFGEQNIIAVKVDTRRHYSRWYPGAGIYRKVTMTMCDPVHLAHWGTFITTPEVKGDSAQIEVRSTVENHLKKDIPVTVETSIFNPSGAKVASGTIMKTAPANNSAEVFQTMTLYNPKLWDITSPEVYTAKTIVRNGRTVTDEYETTFGIRTFEFSADDGFYLNGRRVQIQGVNLHHDHGPLGAAFNIRAMKRQLEIMKEMGVNAIRTSHNPPAPELLDLCDKMGLIVWDECFDKWDRTADHVNGEPLEEFGEKQIRNFVQRDRNHPSIATWSIGNEIGDQFRDNEGKTPERIALMSDFVRKYDPTRPVSYASNDTGELLTDEMFEALDIIGWNYGNRFSLYWHRFPDEKVMYSESAMATSTRGFYELPLPMGKTDFSEKYQLSSYDRNAMPYGDITDLEFHRIEQGSFAAGEFVWTGFDYLGEPTPFSRQGRSSYCGSVDLCGIPKDRYWLYRSHWRPDDTTVHILPHWNWPERAGQSVPVYVYANGDEAELFLNGESLGRRSKEEHPLENPNLALGQPVSASSTAAGAVNAAMNAADGSFDTAWTTAGSGIECVQVDLGEEKEVRHINVLPTTLQTRPGRPGRGPASQPSYTVQISSDGTSWRNTTEIPPDLTARRYVPSYAVTGTARYVRVVFARTMSQAPGIREIEVYRYDIDEAYYYITRRYRLMWEDVSYAPGELRAVAYKNGERIGESVVQTAGNPGKLRLTPEWTEIDADGYDLAYVLVEALDEKGTLCPLADNLVTFEIEGPAEIAGVGNGNPLSLEPFQANNRKLFYGKAMLILRSLRDQSGNISVTARSEDLGESNVTLRSR
ncbi:glycoside hydrolase family 2 TIM barrel-domain containing protein [Candidatus Latescibacterota bacterium]